MNRTPLLIACVAWLPACSGGSTTAPTTSAPVVPTAAFELPATVLAEGTPPGSIRVLLSEPTGQPVSVPLVVESATTATDGDDFTLGSPTLVFPPGQVAAIVDLELLTDLVCEGDELVRLTLGEPSGATLGATVEHDVTIDGSVPELEPNDTGTQALANGPLAQLTATPPVWEALCGDVDEQGAVDGNDVFLFEVLEESRVTVTLVPKDPAADLTLLISELPDTPLHIADEGGPGEPETLAFDWPAGVDLGVIVAATASSAGTAPYELVVSAQPVPPAPLPGPPPVVLREHERITQLKASGATFEELVAALRELSPQRGK